MLTGYNSNLELAKKRAANIVANLKSIMIKNGITIPDVTKGQGYEEVINAGVQDTGGVLDDKRDANFYKPGQAATITITLSGKEDIIDTNKIKENLKVGLKNSTVLWGNYGGDPINNEANPLQSWELKYLPGQGQGKSTDVKPVVRWEFEYNSKKQLTKVTQIPDPGSMGIPLDVKLTFPEKTFIISPPGKNQLAKTVPVLYELLSSTPSGTEGTNLYQRFFGSTVV